MVGVVIIIVVVVVVHVVVDLIAGVDPRNLPLKFGFNEVINRWDVASVVVVVIVIVIIIVVVVVIVIVFVFVVVVCIVVVDTRNISDIESVVGGDGGVQSQPKLRLY